MKKLILTALLLLILPTVIAEQGHMKLLAVSETETGYEGKLADLYLEIKPGSGRVFIETFPLTKFDTQISTRFAKEVACKYLDVDCSNLDFFYILKSDSTTVGGPSASAAETVLTISMLNNIALDDDIAITGAINAGGLIGPVGGIKEKIEAADGAGLKKVLIPTGTRYLAKPNKTDLVEYGAELGLEVVEVTDLDQVIEEFTGIKQTEVPAEIVIDPTYKAVMKDISSQLCNRTVSMQKRFMSMQLDKETLADQLTIIQLAENLTEKGIKSSGIADYSAASYCFGANVQYQFLIFLAQNLSEAEISKETSLVSKEEISFSKTLSSAMQYKTITDIQTYALVKERLQETEDYLNRSASLEGTERLHSLAYAKERLKSAESWAQFFGKGGIEFDLKEDELRQACYSKLAEAEERYQYSIMLFSVELTDTRIDLDRAYSDAETTDYSLCLFKASKAKAEVDALINAYGIDEETGQEMLNARLNIIKKNIVKQTAAGAFPIVGYSYYEYANSLKAEELASAMLYSEYSLELSNLDMYFKKKDQPKLVDNKEKSDLMVFWLGFSLGIIIGILIQAAVSYLFKKQGVKPLRASREKRPHGKKR